MKLTLRAYSFFLAALCLSSIPHFESLASEVFAGSGNNAVSRQTLEALRSTCQKQLHTLDQILSDTIQVIAADTIIVLNKEDKINMLVELRLAVSSLLQAVRSATVIGVNDLNTYLDITEKISIHIDGFLSNLNNIKPFEYVPHKSVSIEEGNIQKVSIEYLHEMAAYNDTLVENLSKKQSIIGLSVYNRVFRKIDSFCSKHYNKFDIALKAGTVGIAALAIFYRYLPSVFGYAPSYANGHLSNGLPPTVIENGVERTNPLNPHGIGEMGKCGEIENYLSGVKNAAFYPHAWPIISSTAGILYGMGSHQVKKYLSGMRNWLKGGIYKSYSVESYEANRMSADITFDDVVGLEYVKQQLREIIEFVKNPEPYARIGSVPPKGVLLYGPPGTGKTHIVEAMSGEIKKAFEGTGKEFKFFTFEACDVLAHGMKQIINVMRNEAPCVIFVDEIDMLRLQRIGNAELLANFLEGMSGIMQGQLSMDLEKQVIVIGATNQIENLDKALLRPGRFGKRIPFEVPTVQERLEFIEKRLSKIYVDMSQFNLEKTALITHGCIYEHLNSAINGMIRKSSDHGIPMNQDLLNEMIDSEIRNVIFGQDKLLPQSELQTIAVHHLGRALTGVLCESRYLLDKITLNPVAVDKEERSVWDRYYDAKENKEKEVITGGVFTYPIGDSLNIATARDQEIKIKELLSGHLAEKILLGVASYSYAPFNNRDQAFKQALTHVCKGVDIASYSKDTENKLRDQAHELIDGYESDLTELFNAHKNRMTLMMFTLLLSKELTQQDMATLLELDENFAEEVIKDSRRFELLDALSSEVAMKSSDVIEWIIKPQDEFDLIFENINKEIERLEIESKKENAAPEEAVSSDLPEIV